MPTPSATPPASRTVGVLLPLPLAGAYDYRVPAGMELAAGDFVAVPLGQRTALGVVWGPVAGDLAEGRLKPVARRLAAPPLPESLRRLVDWVAGYTLSPPGAVLKMAMSVPEALEPPRPAVGYVPVGRAGPAAVRLTPARRRVLATAAEGPPLPAAELARAAGVGPSVVKGLAAAGVLAAVELAPPASSFAIDWRRPGPPLTADQRVAAETLRTRTRSGAGFSVTVLDGVPGAGKTEVYFEAAAEALAGGRQVLVLLPEIALSAQWLKRFAARFGAPPAVWHSDLGQAERRATWRAVAEGRAPVVVGARSALFLPFPDLGLVVVDEEHDASFKQEDGVIYNARDMAVVRARLTGIAAVLVSATPSLETAANVADGRYGALHLPARVGGAALPEVSAIDLRRHPPPRGRFLSPPLVAALAAAFAAGEQAMLFLNRRGYAPLTLCRACGHRLQCPRCTAWLVEHRRLGRVQCHHCGFALPTPRTCPSCAAEASLVPCGPGVERLAEEAAALFPAARVALAASDTLGGPKAAAELVRRIEDREVDLLIGTQIVAKGYHFPLLTLVGVVDADLGLAGGDLRAAERTYPLLYPVAGRAGRAERPGRVLLQTFMPENPVMAALVAGDRARFLAAEAEDRRRAGMPPFGRLVALVVSGANEAEVERMAQELGRAAPRFDGVAVLGPAPAALALLRGRHRRRLLLKARKDIAVQPLVRRWLAGLSVRRNTKIQIDVDPVSFF
jgi:primosomal protein N' (replication factor Y)